MVLKIFEITDNGAISACLHLGTHHMFNTFWQLYTHIKKKKIQGKKRERERDIIRNSPH